MSNGDEVIASEKCFCGNGKVFGAVACQSCMEFGIANGFTWDKVKGNKPDAYAFIRDVWLKSEEAKLKATMEREEAIKRTAEDAWASKVVGQIGIIDPILASTLVARIPGVQNVGTFTKGHGLFRLDVIVLQGPGLCPTAPGDDPPVFGYLEDILDPNWPEEVPEAAHGGGQKVPRHVEKLIREAVFVRGQQR